MIGFGIKSAWVVIGACLWDGLCETARQLGILPYETNQFDTTFHHFGCPPEPT